MQATRILVTGAGGNASQNFIASLRMAYPDLYVVGTDTEKYHLECSDVQARYLVPSCQDPSYLDVLGRIVELERVELVHAQPDPEVSFLAQHRHLLTAKTFLPRAEVITVCQDKLESHARLLAAEVPVPCSVRVQSQAGVEAAFARVRALSDMVWVRAIRGAGSKAALPVRTAAQASNWIAYWVEQKGMTPEDFMFASYLPGREFAFQSLWHEGQLVTSMARQRIEYLFGSLRPSGQSSSPSVAATVHRRDVNEVAEAAVRAVDDKPHGVYCVDLKEDERGMPCVTEINAGRFFTTSNFFAAIGVNMPADYLRLALGLPLDGPRKRFDAAEAGLYWIRGVDRAPTLVKDGRWTSKVPR